MPVPACTKRCSPLTRACCDGLGHLDLARTFLSPDGLDRGVEHRANVRGLGHSRRLSAAADGDRRASTASLTNMELRAAVAGDAEAIADIWHRGWADGHQGNVPDGLYEHRREAHFLVLTSSRVASSTVAVVDDRIVGFVTVRVDEIEEMYVDASARGSGVAAALLAYGEDLIGKGHDTAWLAVVEGNARARRFYERCGWVDAQAFEYTAETTDGPFVVPVRRYEKSVGQTA